MNDFDSSTKSMFDRYKPGPLVHLQSDVQYIGPGQDVITIVKKFLDKYEHFTDNERKVLISVIEFLTNPMCVVTHKETV